MRDSPGRPVAGPRARGGGHDRPPPAAPPGRIAPADRVDHLGRYGLALAASLIAAVLHEPIAAVLAPRVPFLLPFIAVLVSASYGGRGPGLLATAIGVAGAALPPLGWLSTQPSNGLLVIVRFVAFGVAATFVIDRVRRKLMRLRSERQRGASELAALNRELQRRIDELQRVAVTERFLTQASETLAALVDYRSTLESVARLAVPEFADWAAVDMIASDGAIERLAVAHVDPSKVKLAEELHRRFPPDPDAAYGVPRVLREGVPELVSEITEEALRAALPDDERRGILLDLGLRSYMCVPLCAKERTLGVLTFVTAESGRRYDQRDLKAAEELARLAAVAIENARLYEELREADRRKDEFLAVLSHELRNPLAPIREGLEMLAMDSAGRSEMVELMRQQVKHLVRLVDDLLDVSRITRGRVELRTEPLEVAPLLHRAADVMRSTFEQRRQRIEISTPAAPLWVEGDPVRLLQVLENLLQNASKFSDDGARIQLEAQREDDQAVLRVRDGGVGIDAELLPRLFQPFTQAPRSLDRTQGGLGIGLALVRGLVERHGGSVSAASRGPGRGSELTVRLPLHRREPVQTSALRAAPAPSSEPARTARQVLVVDDNQAAARMLALLLGRLGGHRVEVAYEGPGAIAKAQANRPEIVLLDIGMPGMDGYEVCRRLRADPELADILIVALTGYGQQEDRRRSREAGFDEHLVKPPAVEDIARLFAHPRLERPLTTEAPGA